MWKILIFELLRNIYSFFVLLNNYISRNILSEIKEYMFQKNIKNWKSFHMILQ